MNDLTLTSSHLIQDHQIGMSSHQSTWINEYSLPVEYYRHSFSPSTGVIKVEARQAFSWLLDERIRSLLRTKDQKFSLLKRANENFKHRVIELDPYYGELVEEEFDYLVWK